MWDTKRYRQRLSHHADPRTRSMLAGDRYPHAVYHRVCRCHRLDKHATCHFHQVPTLIVRTPPYRSICWFCHRATHSLHHHIPPRHHLCTSSTPMHRELQPRSRMAKLWCRRSPHKCANWCRNEVQSPGRTTITLRHPIHPIHPIR